MTTTAVTEVPEIHKGVFGAALLAGTANVIMQLSWPGVGYGVKESRVLSGRVDLHPVKRQRTTLTYLSVVAYGTDEERDAYKAAVDTSHKQVFNDETSESPVKYHGMNPELQLWVAACIYYGVEDVYRQFYGAIEPADREAVYQHSAKLGTTLQVRESMWPATREAFEEYWEQALEQVHIDDRIRAYLMEVVRFEHLPLGLGKLLATFNTFVTTGFLPPRFRDEMQLTWTPRQQKRFDRLMKIVGFVTRHSPRILREFPFNFYMRDFRRRVRKGKPLV